MTCKRFSGRLGGLPFPRVMCCEFGSLRAVYVVLFQVLFDLLAARTARLQVFRRVSTDLRRSAFARLDLVAEFLQPRCEFRTIDGGCVLLALIQTVWL